MQVPSSLINLKDVVIGEKKMKAAATTAKAWLGVPNRRFLEGSTIL